MSFFVKPTNAPTPKTRNSQTIAVLLAVLFVGMAVTQLYSFDTFQPLMADLGLPVSEIMAVLIAPLIIIAEVFALPFLLRMRVSRAFRWLSAGFVISAAVIWVAISLWTVLTKQIVTNIGLLGDISVIALAPGWWAVLFSVALLVLAVWAVWGLTGTPRKKTIAETR